MLSRKQQQQKPRPSSIPSSIPAPPDLPSVSPKDILPRRPLGKKTNLQRPSLPPKATTVKDANSNRMKHTSKPSTSSQRRNPQRQEQFHRRQASNQVSIPSLPKPSHKPPSSSNDFEGDLVSQDVFAAAFKKRNEKLRVLFPGMARFEMERMDMWNHDSICTPCLIVQPKSDREVSDTLKAYTYGVLKCLSANRKQNANLIIPRLTIAGGRNSISAMRDGCIVLDMSRMRGIKVYPQTNECKIQGGVRVIDLDATLSEYGYVAVSSIFQNLGVVGSILSGGCGFGYASRKYGLACDNVLEAEVVLADGRLKCCSRVRHADLFHALCGGGGGFGVVVSVTLRCYPLLNAALLTYDIPTNYKHEDIMCRRRNIMNQWANWLHGHANVIVKDQPDKKSSSLLDASTNKSPANIGATTTTKGTEGSFHVINEHDGVSDDVYSQLIIPTKQSSCIQFIATSIDDKAIPQQDGFIEEYEEAERKSKRGILGGGVFARLKNTNKCSNAPCTPNNNTSSFKQYTSSTERMKQYGWDKIPNLSDLIVNKFGASSRNNVQFRMVRYADQLQSHSNEYFTSGNIYVATKYVKALTTRVIEIIVQATLGDVSPNNESKIYFHSLGGQISKMSDVHSASFNARQMNYVIFIEGRWEAVAERKYEKEKQKVIEWVNWVINRLNRAEGVQSTSHPESVREQIPKRSKPPNGWYNFDENNGTKLNQTKKKRDPKNVFTLTSRVSWLSGSQFTSTSSSEDTEYDEISPSSSPAACPTPRHSVKDGEIDPSQCLTPKRIQQPDLIETALESLSTDDVEEDDDDAFDYDHHDQNDDSKQIINSAVTSAVNDNDSEGNSVSSELRHLLTISDSDDEFKHWSFSSNTLGQVNYDNAENNDMDAEVDATF